MQDAYDSFRADEARERGRLWYWNVSRQFGKSYSCCVLAVEECLRRPGAQVKYASVDQKMARAIVFPQLEKLLADCPEELLPEFRSQDGIYYFRHNGSRLTIAGADKDNIKKLRGQQAHLAIVDEGGFMGNLQKVVQDVLLPQTTTTGGRIIVASTPPDSAGHYATELFQLCKSRGASDTFTIWQNALLGDAEKKEIVRDMGGEDSTNFKREYLCEFVTDSQNAVVPEFTDQAEKEIVLEAPRPPFFNCLVGLDGGFADPAGALFGYVDYQRAKVVIEDEWLAKGCITADIAEAVAAKENALWRDSAALLPEQEKRRRQIPAYLRRVMDHDPAMAEEFSRNHGQLWQPARKADMVANVNLMNQFIRQRTIEINPRCVNLVRQLHNCTWAGRKMEDGQVARRTFSRNQVDGHFDLVATLMYILREVDLFHNPFPPTARHLNQFIAPEDREEAVSDEDLSVLKLFPSPRF